MSQQVLDPSWISIPFEKYSYNNSRIGARKYDWTHVGPPNDLNLVIEDLHVAEEVGTFNFKTMMQVTAGSEILETQDLRELAERYKKSVSLSESDCPVRVVIRPPVWLAMVFPKSSTTVQRVQFKFNTESDFRKVVAIFSNLGLSTRESPPSRTGTASMPPPSSSPAPSLLSIASVRTPFTAPSSVSRPNSSFQSPSLQESVSSSLIFPYLNAPRIPELSGMAKPPSASVPYSNPHLLSRGTSNTAASLELAANFLYPRQSSTLRAAEHSSLYLSQMKQEPIRCFNNTTTTPIKKIVAELPGPTLVSAQWHPQQNEVLRRDANLRQGTTSPFFSSRVEDLQHIQTSHKDIASFDSRRQSMVTQVTSASAGIELPAPQATNIDAIWDLGIPPKRELPFLKSQPARQIRSLSVFDLPPLPRPEPVTRSGSVIHPPLTPLQDTPTLVNKLVKKRVAQRKAPVSVVTNEKFQFEKAPTNLIADEIILNPIPITPTVELSPLAAKSAARRPASAASVLQSKATTAPRKRAAPTRPTSVTKRPKMIDQGTQTPLIGSNDDNVTINSADGKVFDHVPGGMSVTSPPERYLNDLDNFISKHKNRPAPKELWEIPEYSSFDAEEKDTILNHFICDNLDDANFLQLCKDVEFAWRRIGLGL